MLFEVGTFPDLVITGFLDTCAWFSPKFPPPNIKFFLIDPPALPLSSCKKILIGFEKIWKIKPFL
jgi:hypothetical protein